MPDCAGRPSSSIGRLRSDRGELPADRFDRFPAGRGQSFGAADSFAGNSAAGHGRQSAERNLSLATDRYRLGIDPYLNVITAQTTLLTNQQTAVNLRMQQMTASVQLIEALGGGWDASQLPSPRAIVANAPRPPANPRSNP